MSSSVALLYLAPHVHVNVSLAVPSSSSSSISICLAAAAAIACRRCSSLVVPSTDRLHVLASCLRFVCVTQLHTALWFEGPTHFFLVSGTADFFLVHVLSLDKSYFTNYRELPAPISKRCHRMRQPVLPQPRPTKRKKCGRFYPVNLAVTVLQRCQTKLSPHYS